MKKTITLLLALAMLLAAFAGCGSKSGEPAAPAETVEPAGNETASEPEATEPDISGTTGPEANDPAEPEANEPAETETAAVEPVVISAAVSTAGEIVFAESALTVEDLDNDGMLTVNDALLAVHNAGYEGGAEAGFATADSEYGPMICRLWGEDTSAVGYYNNDVSCWSLADPIAAGDHVVAFVYSDSIYWSDTYSFFDLCAAEAGELTLTLFFSGYDDSWNAVVKPMAGAELVVNGEGSGLFTAEDGTVTLTAEAGTLISAVCEGYVLVPPVCMVAGS